MIKILAIGLIVITTGSAMAVFEILHDDFNIARLSSAASMVSMGRYDDELAVDPDDGPWLEKADLLLALGEYEEAIKCYDEALHQKKAEDSFELKMFAANGKGLALINLGKYDEVLGLLGEALDMADEEALIPVLSPGIYLHNTLGVARYRKGEYGEAFYHFNVAHNYISDEVRSLVAYNCAAAFAHQGNTEMMMPYVEEFCRVVPGYVAAGRIFADGEPVSVDIDLAGLAKEDEAFEEYWDDPEFLEIVGE